MRVLAIVFAFGLIFAAAYAAPESGESGGDCHEESLDLIVKRGEVAYPEGKCLRVSCSDDGETRIEPCEFAIGPNCKVLDGDSTQEYPGCCPKLECE